MCSRPVQTTPHRSAENDCACRPAFDRLNAAMLTAILEKETLAEGITMQDALRQLQLFEDFVSTHLKNAGQEARLAEEHNKLCRQTFQTMLYGLILRT